MNNHRYTPEFKDEAVDKRLDVYQFAQYCKALNLDPSELIKLLE